MENNKLSNLVQNDNSRSIDSPFVKHERSILLNNEFLIKLKNDTNKNDLKEFLCGWSAAFVNILITFPINKVMFRQMAYGVKAKNAVSQFKGENILYVYRGLVPPLISKTISGNLFF